MDTIRESAITAGDLTFSTLEAGSGEPILLLHGFPDTLRSFRHQLPALAGAGYHAVSPALRGYETTTQPSSREADYHVVHVAEDLLAMMDTLSPDAPMHVVGHDWGSVVTQIAVAMQPDRFRSATIIAVSPLSSFQTGLRNHPRQLLLSSYMLFFQLRGIADRVVASRDFAFIEFLWRRWSPDWEWDPADMDALKAAFREPGVLKSALSYYRAFANPVDSECRELMGRMNAFVRAENDVPLLAITGANDGCTDTGIFDDIDPARFGGEVRVERIEGAGHFCHQEKADDVNKVLIDWLT
jgi:pimeloyl-ACP methyl ester carboxylesterase